MDFQPHTTLEWKPRLTVIGMASFSQVMSGINTLPPAAYMKDRYTYNVCTVPGHTHTALDTVYSGCPAAQYNTLYKHTVMYMYLCIVWWAYEGA